MKNSIKILSERELGQYPISISTSLALEGAAGIYPDKEVAKAPLITGKYQLIMMNLLTLYRNLVNSCDREGQLKLKPEAIKMALAEDISGIVATIQKIGNGKVGFLPYMVDYSKLRRAYPNALLKQPSTPLQVTMNNIQNGFLKLLYNPDPRVDPIWPVGIQTFTTLDIKGQYPQSLILTSYLTDLFSRYNFAKLDLLESHTGEIKPHTKWNSKLTNGKELTNIPFNYFTLQVFGDKSHQFVGHTQRVKKAVLELADKERWTVLTTIDKIKVNLAKIQDVEIRKLLLSLL